MSQPAFVSPRVECRVCGSHATWNNGRKHCATCGKDRDDIELRPDGEVQMRQAIETTRSHE